MEGRQVAMKWLAKATSSLKPNKWHPLVPFHLHIAHEAAKPMVTSSASQHVVNYSWLSACQRDMQPFEGDPSMDV